MTHGCPGVDSRGHGLTMSDIHMGRCCELWEAARAEAEPSAAVYVTDVWGPEPDNGIQRLHSPMKEPEPEPELEAGYLPSPDPGGNRAR